MEFSWFLQMFWVMTLVLLVYTIATELFDFKINKKNIIAVIVVVIVIIVFSGGTFHDSAVMNNMEDDIQHQFYFQCDNTMSNRERYELAYSICTTTYNNTKGDFWFPSYFDGDECAYMVVNK